MIFKSPTVQKYILSGAKVVATIRKKGKYKLDQEVIMKVGDKRFHGRVIAVAPLTLFSLIDYVKYSGFDSIGEWINEAMRLHGDDLNPNEYEVVVVEVLRS